MNYVQPSLSRRFFSGVINLLLLDMVQECGAPLFSLGDAKERIPVMIASIVFWIGCIYMRRSPGQYALSLVVVNSEEHPIDRKTAFLRLLPYGLFNLSLILVTTGELVGLSPLVFGSLYGMAILFLLTNLMAVPFSPRRQSLMDMRLRTRVLQTPPVPKLVR